jgi:hypothetical protein
LQDFVTKLTGDPVAIEGSPRTLGYSAVRLFGGAAWKEGRVG